VCGLAPTCGRCHGCGLHWLFVSGIPDNNYPKKNITWQYCWREAVNKDTVATNSYRANITHWVYSQWSLWRVQDDVPQFWWPRGRRGAAADRAEPTAPRRPVSVLRHGHTAATTWATFPSAATQLGSLYTLTFYLPHYSRQNDTTLSSILSLLKHGDVSCA